MQATGLFLVVFFVVSTVQRHFMGELFMGKLVKNLRLSTELLSNSSLKDPKAQD
jgi:hypothetical protein